MRQQHSSATVSKLSNIFSSLLNYLAQFSSRYPWASKITAKYG
jgi:hypothetical protein